MTTRVIKPILKLALAGIVLLNFQAAAFTQAVRCGGDGPKPFFDTPNESLPTTLNTETSVEEFNYLEKSDAVVYRNNQGELRLSNSAGDFSAGQVGAPIDRLNDPLERVILAKNAGYLFDLMMPQYGWMPFYEGVMHHVFWDNSALYSVGSHKGVLGKRFVDIYQLPRNTVHPKAACSFSLAMGETLYLAEGHSFPNIYFYEIEKRLGRELVKLKTFDVESCSFTKELTFTDGFTSPVQGVYRFEHLDSTAVKVDNGSENLYWQTGSECRYFDIGNQQPMFPDAKKPYVLTWTNSKLTLYSLNGQKKSELLRNFPFAIEDVRTRDAWFNSRGTELLVSAKIKGQELRKILKVKVDLKKLLSRD